MAYFEKTLKNLKEIGSALGSMQQPQVGPGPQLAGAQQSTSFAQNLVDVLSKEDYMAVKVALLCDKLITKYKGRAV